MWLIGMMGSGKSTVGAAAAERLAVPFYDTDQMVAERIGMPVPDIFVAMGEKRFREIECQAVAEVPTGALAAAGGGAVLDPVNRRVMVSMPPVVWLRASPRTLAGRVGDGVGRPLLAETGPETRLQEILTARAGLYAEVATHVIDTDERPLDEVVDQVVGLWRR